MSSSQIDAIHRDSSNLERIQKPPNAPPNTQWIGGYKVGVGGNGVATMWVLIDKFTHRAVHHVVIKDSFERASESTKETGLYKGIYRQLKDKGMDFGADPTHNIGHAAPEHRFLKEAYLQGLMTVPDSSEEIYCNPLWGYARRLLDNPYSSAHNHWRLYMPLYDYGDLDNLIKSHYFANQVSLLCEEGHTRTIHLAYFYLLDEGCCSIGRTGSIASEQYGLGCNRRVRHETRKHSSRPT